MGVTVTINKWTNTKKHNLARIKLLDLLSYVSFPHHRPDQFSRNRPQPSPGAAAAVEDPSDSMADISAEELAAAMEAEREWEKEEKDDHSQSRARSPDSSEQDRSFQNAEGQGGGRSGGEREEWGGREAGCEDSCMEMGLSSPVIAVQCPSTGKVWQHPFYLCAWAFWSCGGDPKKEHFQQGLC